MDLTLSWGHCINTLTLPTHQITWDETEIFYKTSKQRSYTTLEQAFIHLPNISYFATFTTCNFVFCP